MLVVHRAGVRVKTDSRGLSDLRHDQFLYPKSKLVVLDGQVIEHGKRLATCNQWLDVRVWQSGSCAYGLVRGGTGCPEASGNPGSGAVGALTLATPDKGSFFPSFASPLVPLLPRL